MNSTAITDDSPPAPSGSFVLLWKATTRASASLAQVGLTLVAEVAGTVPRMERIWRREFIADTNAEQGAIDIEAGTPGAVLPLGSSQDAVRKVAALAMDSKRVA